MISKGFLLARDHASQETKNKTKQQEPGMVIFANMWKGSMKKLEKKSVKRGSLQGKENSI